MKKSAFTLALMIATCLSATAQDNIEQLTAPIIEEGKRLYRLEMASWHGTDLFMEHFTEQDKIGGYFSYNEGNISRCIFFSKDDTPTVLGTITFDTDYNRETAVPDYTARDFTTNEADLYALRRAAVVAAQKDPLFIAYKNTNLNFIPMISGGEKKVYILTSTEKEGIVIFGNDYLLRFDDNNKVIAKKRLHQSMIKINSREAGIAMHSHLPETGDFFTATDICTLMLYKKLTAWKKHMVVSDRYISTWDCDTEELTVTPTAEQQKRDKKKDKKD